MNFYLLSVWGQLICFFSIFNFYAWFIMLFKGMDERFLQSEDEPLTPNIDGVMTLWIFRRRAQTAENRRKSAIIGPFESIFYLFSPPPPGRFVSEFIFPSTTEPSALGKKTPVHGRAREGGENKSPNLVQPISPYKSTFLHFGSGVWPLFWF